MNKAGFIERFAEENSISIKLSRAIVENILDSVKESLCNNKRIEIRGFGSFFMKEYRSYSGRNPKTGEKISVGKKILPVFKASRNSNTHSDNKKAQ